MLASLGQGREPCCIYGFAQQEGLAWSLEEADGQNQKMCLGLGDWASCRFWQWLEEVKIKVKAGSFQNTGLCSPSPFQAVPMLTLSFKAHVPSYPSIHLPIHSSLHPSIHFSFPSSMHPFFLSPSLPPFPLPSSSIHPSIHP